MTAITDRYMRTATRSAREVIGAYSTSFGAATRLLGARHRDHVRNIYALVRVADELVDGVAQETGLDADAQRRALNRYEAETLRAMRSGFSTDLVVHAFANTARTVGIDENLVQPFFDSMRADISLEAAGSAVRMNDVELRGLDNTAHAQYVYGSAEVVGLMCLRVFLREANLTTSQQALAENGAQQLGAAFQNINFLRDLADDTHRLGRSYLSATGQLSQAEVDAWLRRIADELEAAELSLLLLPRDARIAVRCALDLFAELAHRITRTPFAHLYRERVRVPNGRKAFLLIRSTLRTWREPR